MGQEVEKDYTFRAFKPDDLNFILSSWGSSFYKGSKYASILSPRQFHYFHRPIRENLFKRNSFTVIMCCAKENENLIIGWIAVEEIPQDSESFLDMSNVLLHYVYVKEAFKRMGIASELYKKINPSGKKILYTHETDKSLKIIKTKRYDNFYFMPHLI